MLGPNTSLFTVSSADQSEFLVPSVAYAFILYVPSVFIGIVAVLPFTAVVVPFSEYTMLVTAVLFSSVVLSRIFNVIYPLALL